MKCCFENCKNQSVVIGKCKYCTNLYCNIHRIVEKHSCININICKLNALKNLEIKLLNGKCSNIKIQKI